MYPPGFAVYITLRLLGESVLEALISSLLVTAISGLTFLSYKHHDGYKVISRSLKVCACAVFISLTAYDLGFTAGKYGGTELSMMWTHFGFIGFWILLAFLDILPMIIDQGGKRSRENNVDKHEPPKTET